MTFPVDPPPSNKLCGCRKTGAWVDRTKALEGLKKVQDHHITSGSTRKMPIRVYRCPEGVWHLTSWAN